MVYLGYISKKHKKHILKRKTATCNRKLTFKHTKRIPKITNTKNVCLKCRRLNNDHFCQRKTIPKSLKNQVWDTYIGQKKGIGPCHVCQNKIDSKTFECGHIVSVYNKGKTLLHNLRPICSTCNKSVGTTNLNLFKQEFHGEITSCHMCYSNMKLYKIHSLIICKKCALKIMKNVSQLTQI